MKRLLIVLMAFAFSVSVKAQDTSDHKMHHQMKDCVMMDGTVKHKDMTKKKDM